MSRFGERDIARLSLEKLRSDFEMMRYGRTFERLSNPTLVSYERERAMGSCPGKWAKFLIAIPTKATYDALTR